MKSKQALALLTDPAMPFFSRRHGACPRSLTAVASTARIAACLAGSLAASLAFAQPAVDKTPPRDPLRATSAMDAPMFYQVLLGELELLSGQAGNAYEILLDAARRSKEASLFKRAVDIAIQGRAGEQALAATRAWRLAQPMDPDAVRTQVQLLGALGRILEAQEPLRALIQLTPRAERAGLVMSLPRVVQRGGENEKGLQLLQRVLEPLATDASMAAPVKVALGRAHLAAGQGARALTLAQEAHALDRSASGPVLLALELMPTQPQAERLVQQHLAQPGAEVPLRLAYVRTLVETQRVAEAIRQLQQVNREQPQLAAPYLTLGALELELRHFAQSEAALLKYLELTGAPQAPAGSTAPTAPAAQAPARATAVPPDEDDDDDEPGHSGDGAEGRVQAWLLLSRGAEQRGDFKAAEAWLARVDDPRRALDVQTRRATLLARQGRINEARQTLQQTPERGPQDTRAKLLAEATVLREVKRWQDAYGVLADANSRFADDIDLLYEQAMVAEKIGRVDELERLLRRVIELKPDHAQAFNALGYSLADRNQRLPEARQLVQRALELMPGDPFITDSLGWIEFRLGNLPEAIRLLREAYQTRPDAEIGAHLGEALWAAGQRDEALEVFRRARARDADNEVLRETLQRLKVRL